jgi:hypothetical protein
VRHRAASKAARSGDKTTDCRRAMLAVDDSRIEAADVI